MAKRKAPRPFTQAERETIAKEYRAGAQPFEIARKHQRPHSSIRSLLSKLRPDEGIEPAPEPKEEPKPAEPPSKIERAESIALAYRNGASAGEVMQRFEIGNYPALYKILDYYKVPRHMNGGPRAVRAVVQPEVRALVLEDRAAGIPNDEIIKKHQIKRSTFFSILRTAGVIASERGKGKRDKLTAAEKVHLSNKALDRAHGERDGAAKPARQLVEWARAQANHHGKVGRQVDQILIEIPTGKVTLKITSYEEFTV